MHMPTRHSKGLGQASAKVGMTSEEDIPLFMVTNHWTMTCLLRTVVDKAVDGRALNTWGREPSSGSQAARSGSTARQKILFVNNLLLMFAV